MLKLTLPLTILCAVLLLAAPAYAADDADDGVTVLTAKVSARPLTLNPHPHAPQQP